MDPHSTQPGSEPQSLSAREFVGRHLRYVYWVVCRMRWAQRGTETDDDIANTAALALLSDYHKQPPEYRNTSWLRVRTERAILNYLHKWRLDERRMRKLCGDLPYDAVWGLSRDASPEPLTDLSTVLGRINPLLRDLIQDYFGLGGRTPLTVTGLSRKYGLPRAHVRNSLESALNWMAKLCGVEHDVDMRQVFVTKNPKSVGRGPSKDPAANPLRKLTPEQERELVSLAASGAYSRTELGKRFGVSRVSVTNIVNRHRKYVTAPEAHPQGVRGPHPYG